MGKTKDLSKDGKNIVLNLFKFFHDYQRATVKIIKSFLSFGLLDSGGLLPFTTLFTEL
jgi:hypothetical protein